MATELTKPLIRDTGLTHEDKPALVTLIPTAYGGSIIFKQKGSRGKGVEVTLAKVMADATGVKRTPVANPKGAEDSPDLIALGTLESRIMIDAGDVLTPEVKGVLCSIVREIREERREDLGLPKLLRGAERSRNLDGQD